MLRRGLLKQLAARLLVLTPDLSRSAMPGTAADTSEPSNETCLLTRARALAARPYRLRSTQLPKPLVTLGWGGYQSVGYRPDHALWAGQHLPSKARFFHLGPFFRSTVQMHGMVDGHARLIAYDPAMFDYGQDGLTRQALPADLDFAGFRLTTKTGPTRDVTAFLGASYFHAIGEQWQYGISARDLTIDTGLPRVEEFPDFTEFWLVHPAADTDTARIYTLLGSPSVADIYRFDIRPSNTLVVDVAATLYMCKPIERLGVTPLTSMFLYGENDRTDHAGDRRNVTHRWRASDWCPEIHDSDGLAIWRGSDEWIWQPLANPPMLRSQCFANDSPRGFGLLQRGRNPDRYQDDSVFYEKYPNIWVEPTHDWSEDAVELVGLSANGGTFDNIIAFWRPAVTPYAGQELTFGYRLTQDVQPAAVLPLARVVVTHMGVDGVVRQPRKYFSWRSVVSFVGGRLSRLEHNTAGSTVEPAVHASRGRVEIASAQPLASVDGVRIMFDVVSDTSNTPVGLLLTLQPRKRLLSETWAYQQTPPADRGM